jgi:RNA polymerase sigma factor (TIGR02999 family)
LDDLRQTVTMLLARVSDGQPGAVDDLLPLVYDQLRSMAGSRMANERSDHTLQATALVNEAYLKLAADPALKTADRRAFFGIAARAMRQILVDHARTRNRLKRGGDWKRVEVEPESDAPGKTQMLDVIAVDEALEELATLDPRKARLVELRYFAGMTSEDAGELLGISRATVAREWRMCRAWLASRLSDGGEVAGDG